MRRSHHDIYDFPTSPINPWGRLINHNCIGGCVLAGHQEYRQRPPQDCYLELRRGTLVMFRATLHAFSWKERRANLIPSQGYSLDWTFRSISSTLTRSAFWINLSCKPSPLVRNQMYSIVKSHSPSHGRQTRWQVSS